MLFPNKKEIYGYRTENIGKSPISLIPKRCPYYVSDIDGVRILAVCGGLSELNILICVLKMNKGLRGLERHEAE